MLIPTPGCSLAREWNQRAIGFLHRENNPILGASFVQQRAQCHDPQSAVDQLVFISGPLKL